MQQTSPLLAFRPTVLVLASGRGERFRASGGTVHKLQALLGGTAVLERTLAAVRESGLPWHLEQAAHPGMGDAIAAAVRATPNPQGWLILPADLPLIRPLSLLHVAERLERGTLAAVVPWVAGRPAHPVGFAASAGPQLMVLRGDEGARSVLHGLRALHMVDDIILDDPGAVADVDTLADLAAAERLLSGG
ncbi:nucleotidyltransferase family protein [Xylophilus sp. ASV27]|uniref:nucleotidyltransferase family protein n=1 Tax=Xylophilus sp. ASV27 TaxID=2795129 RepID=UPI0018EBF2AE|nr:NTP transferase domain-containing protein [Xylophilus sp. ASV27]